MAGRGHAKHPLNVLVAFTLGNRRGREEERAFRRHLSRCRRYYDRELTDDRERRFALEYILSRCDATEAARAANLLPIEEKPTAVDYEHAARRMRREPRVEMFLRDLIRLCRLDEPDRGLIIAEMMSALQKPISAREKIQAATLLMRLCPDLAKTDETKERARILALADNALRSAASAGRLSRSGEMISGEERDQEPEEPEDALVDEPESA